MTSIVIQNLLNSKKEKKKKTVVYERATVWSYELKLSALTRHFLAQHMVKSNAQACPDLTAWTRPEVRSGKSHLIQFIKMCQNCFIPYLESSPVENVTPLQNIKPLIIINWRLIVSVTVSPETTHTFFFLLKSLQCFNSILVMTFVRLVRNLLSSKYTHWLTETDWNAIFSKTQKCHSVRNTALLGLVYTGSLIFMFYTVLTPCRLQCKHLLYISEERQCLPRSELCRHFQDPSHQGSNAVG